MKKPLDVENPGRRKELHKEPMKPTRVGDVSISLGWIFLQTVVWLCGSNAYRFADVDTRFGDRFAGLAVKTLWQCG